MLLGSVRRPKFFRFRFLWSIHLVPWKILDLAIRYWLSHDSQTMCAHIFIQKCPLWHVIKWVRQGIWYSEFGIMYCNENSNFTTMEAVQLIFTFKLGFSRSCLSALVSSSLSSVSLYPGLADWVIVSATNQSSVFRSSDQYCQARVRSSKVQSPKIKTKSTWA